MYVCIYVCVCIYIIINIKVYNKTFSQFITNYSWFQTLISIKRKIKHNIKNRKLKSYCGGKIRQSTVGHGTRTKPNHNRKRRHGQRTPQPNHVGPGLLKGRPRRSASSDAPNGSPIYTLYMVKGHPKSKEKARRSGGNHNYCIKCKEATFPATLMWRGQENSIILASATHRKEGGCPMGQALKQRPR